MRRGYLWRRNPNTQPKLKEATQVALREAKEEEDSEERTLLCKSSPESEDRQKMYGRRRQQRAASLREQILAAPQQGGQPYESDFDRTRKTLPERDRLAPNLFLEGSLRDKIGRSDMNDLIALCLSNGPRTNFAGLKCVRIAV